jgi:hypothetical protein
MYLAYSLVNIGSELEMRLCLVPDKPDMFSYPIPVEKFLNCDSAVCRVGPGDTCTIQWLEAEKTFMIKAVSPSKMYLTPELPTKPGVHITRLRLIKRGVSYETFYGQERDSADTWKEWKPCEMNL